MLPHLILLEYKMKKKELTWHKKKSIFPFFILHLLWLFHVFTKISFQESELQTTMLLSSEIKWVRSLSCFVGKHAVKRIITGCFLPS